MSEQLGPGSFIREVPGVASEAQASLSSGINTNVGQAGVNYVQAAPGGDFAGQAKLDTQLIDGLWKFAEKLAEPSLMRAQQEQLVAGMSRMAQTDATLKQVNDEQPALARIFGDTFYTQGARQWESEEISNRNVQETIDKLDDLKKGTPEEFNKYLMNQQANSMTGDPHADKVILSKAVEKMPLLMSAHAQEHRNWLGDEFTRKMSTSTISMLETNRRNRDLFSKGLITQEQLDQVEASTWPEIISRMETAPSQKHGAEYLSSVMGDLVAKGDYKTLDGMPKEAIENMPAADQWAFQKFKDNASAQAKVNFANDPEVASMLTDFEVASINAPIAVSVALANKVNKVYTDRTGDPSQLIDIEKVTNGYTVGVAKSMITQQADMDKAQKGDTIDLAIQSESANAADSFLNDVNSGKADINGASEYAYKVGLEKADGLRSATGDASIKAETIAKEILKKIDEKSGGSDAGAVSRKAAASMQAKIDAGSKAFSDHRALVLNDYGNTARGAARKSDQDRRNDSAAIIDPTAGFSKEEKLAAWNKFKKEDEYTSMRPEQKVLYESSLSQITETAGSEFITEDSKRIFENVDLGIKFGQLNVANAFVAVRMLRTAQDQGTGGQHLPWLSAAAGGGLKNLQEVDQAFKIHGVNPLLPIEAQQKQVSDAMRSLLPLANKTDVQRSKQGSYSFDPTNQKKVDEATAEGITVLGAIKDHSIVDSPSNLQAVGRLSLKARSDHAEAIKDMSADQAASFIRGAITKDNDLRSLTVPIEGRPEGKDLSELVRSEVREEGGVDKDALLSSIGSALAARYDSYQSINLNKATLSYVGKRLRIVGASGIKKTGESIPVIQELYVDNWDVVQVYKNRNVKPDGSEIKIDRGMVRHK